MCSELLLCLGFLVCVNEDIATWPDQQHFPSALALSLSLLAQRRSSTQCGCLAVNTHTLMLQHCSLLVT